METRILVIRGGAIGDFMLTLPVLAALRRHFPGAGLSVLGYPHVAQLAVAGGLADDVRPIEDPGMAPFFVEGGQLPSKWIEYFQQFSTVVSYLHDPAGVFLRNLKRCARARYVLGPHRPEVAPRQHATETLLKPLEEIGVFAADPTPRLQLGEELIRCSTAPGNEIAQNKRPMLLGAHPGSGSERKNWPEPAWASLLQRLAATTMHNLLLVGGEAEGERATRLAALWPPHRLQVAQGIQLVELALRLRLCTCFLGHDSGITHLAAALGVPGLVLWGETDPVVWRPRSNKMRLILAPEGLASLDADRVWDAMVNFLATEKDSQLPEDIPW